MAADLRVSAVWAPTATQSLGGLDAGLGQVAPPGTECGGCGGKGVTTERTVSLHPCRAHRTHPALSRSLSLSLSLSLFLSLALSRSLSLSLSLCHLGNV
jgi:hypothetical protein